MYHQWNYVPSVKRLQWLQYFGSALFVCGWDNNQVSSSSIAFHFKAELLCVLKTYCESRRGEKCEAQRNIYHVLTKTAIVILEQFSIECRKTKTRVITLANHKGHR